MIHAEDFVLLSLLLLPFLSPTGGRVSAFVVRPTSRKLDNRVGGWRSSIHESQRAVANSAIVSGAKAGQPIEGSGRWPRYAGGASARGLSHVLFLEPEDRDQAFALLEGYIQRESESSGERGRKDFDRVRGIVPHMRKRMWKAPDQDAAAEELGMDEFQFAMKEYIPGVTSKPWWEPDAFLWAKGLEDASPVIQEEYRSFRDNPASDSIFTNSREGGYTSSGWTHIPLVSRREPDDRYAPQREHFPKTMKILRDLGVLSQAREVMIGRQAPNSGIKMHSDGSNAVIAVHLGLDVPGEEECLMWVGVNMERRAWRNNKLLCMDTSYLHWTRNNTDNERIILLLRVWHPDLTPKERRVMEYLDSLLRHAADGKPLPTQPLVSAAEGGV